MLGQKNLYLCKHIRFVPSTMLVIDRMATTTTISFSLFSHSLRLLSKSKSSSSPFTSFGHCFSVAARSRGRQLASVKRTGFCTAVATTESTETGTNAEEKKVDDRNFSQVKIKLPTNDSSEKLLRIRHSVRYVRRGGNLKWTPSLRPA